MASAVLRRITACGWRASKVKITYPTGQDKDPQIVAPAEVEIP